MDDCRRTHRLPLQPREWRRLFPWKGVAADTCSERALLSLDQPKNNTVDRFPTGGGGAGGGKEENGGGGNNAFFPGYVITEVLRLACIPSYISGPSIPLYTLLSM